MPPISKVTLSDLHISRQLEEDILLLEEWSFAAATKVLCVSVVYQVSAFDALLNIIGASELAAFKRKNKLWRDKQVQSLPSKYNGNISSSCLPLKDNYEGGMVCTTWTGKMMATVGQG